MAKITPSALIQSMSGKVCSHSDTYFVTNPQTGRVHTGRICNEPNQPNSEAQLAIRKSFGERSAKVKSWFAANRPSDTNPSGTDSYIEQRTKYKAQHKIGSFVAYIHKHIDELTDSASTPSSTDTQSGGSSSNSGSTQTGTGSGSSLE